jgi:hypothetical protein
VDKKKHGDAAKLRGRGSCKMPFSESLQQQASANEEGDGPVAKRLVAAIKKHGHRKVVNLQDVIDGRAAAAEQQKTVVSKEGLARLYPAHAAYVFTQNQVSVIAEQITALDEMTPFAEMVSRAQDLYLPSGPPMSPLTRSYFTSWAFFDACVGPASETIGTCIIEVGRALGMDTGLLRLIQVMQRSRMGVYVYEGSHAGLVTLRELVTDSVCRAIVPAAHGGQVGELWYVRVLPPPAPGIVEHVAFTTPYVLLEPSVAEWQAYFRRTVPEAPPQVRLDAYERHMKYGPTRTYWNDFVFEGYVTHRTEAIFLAGLPDVPESRPHSEANNRHFRQ